MRALYFGHTEGALRFQGVLLVLDLLIIGFFIGSQFIARAALVLDRRRRNRRLSRRSICWRGCLRSAACGAGSTIPTTWIDLVVLATLAFPTVLHNWGFLRILRLYTLVRSERFWNVLARGRWDDTYVEDLTRAIVTLVVFIFMAAGVDAGAVRAAITRSSTISSTRCISWSRRSPPRVWRHHHRQRRRAAVLDRA